VCPVADLDRRVLREEGQRRKGRRESRTGAIRRVLMQPCQKGGCQLRREAEHPHRGGVGRDQSECKKERRSCCRAIGERGYWSVVCPAADLGSRVLREEGQALVKR